MTTNYRRGYAAEKFVRRYLEAEGYNVVESRGSHGPADLVAIGRNVVVVQVKRGEENKATAREKEELRLLIADLPALAGVPVHYAYVATVVKVKNRRVILWDLVQ